MSNAIQEIAKSNAYVFSDASSNDILFRSKSASQHILLGTTSNTNAGMVLGESNISFTIQGNSNTIDNAFTFATGDSNKVVSILGSGRVGLGTTAPVSQLQVVGDVTVSGNILPSGPGQDIGASNARFQNAWIDTLHLASNTLYLGDTPVLGINDSGVVYLQGEEGQSVKIGSTLMTAEDLVSVNLVACNMAVSNIFIDGTILKVPTGTTSQRPDTPSNGYMRYNSETSSFEGYGPGGAWGSLGGVIDLDRDTFVSAETFPGSNDNALRMFTAGAERMRVANSGYVGIGTTNPQVALQVAGQVTASNVTANIGALSNLTVAQQVTTPAITSSNVTTSNLTANISALSNLTVAQQVTTPAITSSNITTSNITVSNVTASNVTVANQVTTHKISLSGDIVPTSTSLQDIGTSNFRFREAWIDTLHISENTLYLGDTPVLGTSGDTVNIRADSNQSINVITAGTGTTNVSSTAGVVLTASGLNANVTVQATGSGGQALFGATNSMSFTAPTTSFSCNVTIGKYLTVNSNLTVTGDLAVTGTVVAINTSNLEIADNIILLNKGQTGNGMIANGQSGFRVSRGDAADYLVVFDEATDTLQAGMMGSLETVATRPWSQTNFAASNAQSNWNYGSNTSSWTSNNRLPLTGGTLSGALTVNATLTATSGYFGSAAGTRTALTDRELKFIGTGFAHYSIFNSNNLFTIRNTSTNDALGTTGTTLLSITSAGDASFTGAISEGGSWLSTKYALSNAPFLPLAGGTLTGNVGIGTSAVAGIPLYINTTSGNSWLRVTQGSTSTNIAHFGMEGGVTKILSDNGDIAFRTAGGGVWSDKLTMKNTGELGIGTTLPSEKLHVQDGSLKIANSSYVTGQSNKILFNHTGNATTTIASALPGNNMVDVLFTTCSNSVQTETLRLQNGRVGIGTTSPQTTLEIYHATNPKIFLNRAGTSTYFFSGISTSLDLGSETAGRDIRLMPSGTTAVTIKSGGNVGIGTDPSFRLDVQGNARFSDEVAMAGYSAQWTLSGGGTVTWNGSSILWSTRVIAIPVEKTELSTNGHIDITCPISGTVVYYTTTNTISTVTCTAAGVPLNAWEALWYRITSGQSQTTVQTQFAVTHYNNAEWRPTTNWMLIAVRNGDATGHVKWIPGQINLPLTSCTYNSQTSVPSWLAPIASPAFTGSISEAGTALSTKYALSNAPFLPLAGGTISSSVGAGGMLKLHQTVAGGEASIGFSNNTAVAIMGLGAYSVSSSSFSLWGALTVAAQGGNIGIGTTTPSEKLSIVGTNYSLINPTTDSYSEYNISLYNVANAIRYYKIGSWSKTNGSTCILEMKGNRVDNSSGVINLHASGVSWAPNIVVTSDEQYNTGSMDAYVYNDTTNARFEVWVYLNSYTRCFLNIKISSANEFFSSPTAVTALPALTLFHQVSTNRVFKLENTGTVTVTGGLNHVAGQVLDLGHAKVGREANAGKIGYEIFTAGSLDIVGAGTSSRSVKIWDHLTVLSSISAATFAGSGASLTALNAGNITTGTLANARTTATSANTASAIVARDAAGDFNGRYINSEFMNMSHAASSRTADTVFYSSTDNYIRKNDAAGMRASLVVPTRTGGDASGTWGISITGNAATATSATTAANYLPLAGGTMTGNITWNGSGTNYIGNGNADNATLTNYNLRIQSWWGIGFPSYDNVNRIVFDTRSGNITISGTFSGSGASLTALNATNISSGTLAVARGGTGATATTGTGNNVLSASPTFTGTVNVAALTASGLITAANSSIVSGDGNGMYFWGDGGYRIHMSAATNATWGGRVSGDTTSDYNMYFKMYGGTNRGFVFLNGTTAVGGFDGGGNLRWTGTATGNGAGVTNLNAGNITTGTLANDRTTATNINTGSAIVARDANGDFSGRYINADHFFTSHAAGTRNADTVFYSSTDNYIRKNNATGMRASLVVPTRTGGDASGTWGISITGNAATATTAANYLPLAGGSLTGNLLNTASYYSSNWYRSYGNGGWYSETHGGGWFMQDASWIRSYNSKGVWVDNAVLGCSYRIGAGTSAPAYPLDVVGTARVGAAGTATSLHVGNSTYTNASFPRFISALDSTIGAGGTRCIGFGKAATFSNSGEIIYHHAGDGSGNNRIDIGHFGGNAMSILANRRIGVNTQAPGYTLDVAGDINFTGTLRQNGTAFSSGGGGGWTTGTGIVYTQCNVGIGTASPSTNLHIQNAGTAGTARTILTLDINDSQTGTTGQLDFAQLGTTTGRIANIYQAAAKVGFAFSTWDSALTERVRITAEGNCGIGTSAPSAKLQVNGTTVINDGSTGSPATGTNGGAGTRLVLWHGDAVYHPYSMGIASATLWYSVPSSASHFWYVGGTARMSVNTALNVDCRVRGFDLLARTHTYVDEQGAYIQWNRDGASGQTYIMNQKGGGGGGILFGSVTTTNVFTEQMRIDSSGNVAIGTTAPAGKWHLDNGKAVIGGLTTTQATAALNIRDHANRLIDFYWSTTRTGGITTDGASTTYHTTSDYRLKENLTPLTNAISRLQQIPVYRFNFISNPNKVFDGFLAHEVQAIIPEAVVGDKDAVDEHGNIDAQGIDQSKIVPLLTKALQELNTKHETEVAALQAQVATLEAQITALQAKNTEQDTEINAIKAHLGI